MALTQTPEEGLKVSNAPSDGKYLQYKDSTDKLTWADVPATSTDFTITNSGTDHWVFTGGGLSSANDPDIRVDPGQTYKFINNCSANSNPFTIQKYDGSAWVTYSDGVTNNGGQGQTTIEFTPHQDCPAILRYINTGATNMTGFLSTNDPSGGTLREMNFKTDGSGNNRGFEVVNGAVGAGGTDSRLFFGGYSNSGSTALIDANVSTLTYCAPIQYFKHTSGSNPNTFLTFNNSSTPKVEINQDWKSEGHVTFLDNKEVNVGTHNDGSLYSTGTGITLAAKTPSAGSTGHVNIVTTSGNSVILNASSETIGIFQSALATLYGTVDIQGPDNSNAGTLRIRENHSGSANHVSITVPDDGVTSDYTITLPAAAPSANGQVLSATTAGVASWTTIAGGVDSDSDKNTVAGENAGNAGTWSGAEKNTCVGYNAGTDLTSGDENIFIGNEAGANQTTGYKNVAIGSQALETSTNGFENIVIGWDAMPHVSYGTQCIAIGSKAMNQATGTGTRECVAIGHDALYELTGTNYTDSYGCTAVGYMAGEDVTTTYEMGFFGRQAGKGQTMTWGELWMAHRDHNKGTASVWIHGSQSGACTQGNNSSSWTTTSDERIKKNIVDNNVGLDKINQLKVRNFEYRVQVETGTDDTGHTTWAPKTDSDIIDTSTFNTLADGKKPKPHQVAINTEGVQIGCIAQEVEAVLPGCVKTDANGVKSVDTDEMFWVMVNAIKQLSAKNDALEARVAALETG